MKIMSFEKRTAGIESATRLIDRSDTVTEDVPAKNKIIFYFLTEYFVDTKY